MFLINFLFIILIITGCSHNTININHDDSNIGKWYKGNADYINKNQFQIDKNYCTGVSSVIQIPAYMPSVTVGIDTPQYINGNYASFDYTTGKYTYGNFSGVTQNMGSKSITIDYSNASINRAMAIREKNNLWQECMQNLGWEQFTKEVNEFAKIYWIYSNEIMKVYNQFLQDNLSYLKTKLYTKKNLNISKQEKITKRLKLTQSLIPIKNELELYISKNLDKTYTSYALYSLAKIYRFNNTKKYIELLEQSAKLNYIKAEYELAQIFDNKYYRDNNYLLDNIHNYIFNKYVNNSQQKLAQYTKKSLYYYSKIAKRFIPKQQSEQLEFNNKKSFLTKSPYFVVLDARYKIGIEYLRGINLEPNKKLGLKYITNAAKQGHTVAMLELVIYYYENKNYQKTKYWLRKYDIFDKKFYFNNQDNIGWFNINDDIELLRRLSYGCKNYEILYKIFKDKKLSNIHQELDNFFISNGKPPSCPNWMK